MVNPIHPGGGPSEASYQTPAERQRLFELQWEISLIGCFIAATSKNSELSAECSKLKNDLSGGGNPAQVASELNFLIGKVNQTIEPDKAPLPSFHFTDESSALSLKGIVTTFEKYILTLREHNHLDPLEETKFWTDAQNIFASITANTNPRTAFQDLQSLIEQVNKQLPAELQVPKLPAGLISGR